LDGLGLSINPGFVLLGAFLYFAGGWAAVAALYSAMLAHELGHLIVLELIGTEVRRVRIGAAGAVIELAGELTRRQDMGVTAAGPIAGLVFSIACICADTPFFRYAGLISLLATAFNLLPVYPMDGGRLAFLLLSTAVPLRASETVMRVIGTLCGICVMISGIILRSAAAAAAGIWMTVLANAPGLR